jgi:hypothetical protein
MRKIFGLLLLVVAVFAVYWFAFRKKESVPKPPKEQPIAVKRHSAAFNTSIENLMNAYFSIKDAFVDADTARAKASTRDFIALLDSIPVVELQKEDSLISNTAKANIEDIKLNANSLLDQKDITIMRQDFRTISDMLYPGFFGIINYEGKDIYLHNCPMAFDGDKDANWISNSNEVINPYLGKNHPKYKGTMLHCGEVKDSITGKN